MIHIRTEKEIELLRKSSQILAEVKQIIWDFIEPGVNLLEIDALAEKEIKNRGAKSNFKHYHGFPNVSCISVNEVLIHGIPSDYVVKEGDIVSIDLGCIWKGYHSDSAFTKGVGKISSSSQKVIDVAKEAFYAGLNAIKRGARIGDIENAIGKYIKSQGMYTPDNFTGHGIGTELHMDPYVRNSGAAKTGVLLKDGMVICIEPMILQESKNVKILKDGWTVVAEDGKHAGHYEHTVLIENGEAVILSEGI
ncbi:MAG: type I methionyl aminopeptidase [Mycoplasmataceae bacterium]|nr:type I methionyl aminopeptidase [Mycoplasmataceae bacterium]